MNKVVVIGCDGATWDVLQPMIDAGKLPGFAKLQQTGAYGKLKSTLPPLTAPGWTTGVTGRNPGKHNIFDFVKRNSKDYQLHLTSRRDRKCRALWNYVSDAGGTVLVMNVPHTYPPEKVNGTLITGMGTPENVETFTSPPEATQRIKNQFPNYRVSLETSTIEHGDMTTFVKELVTHTKTQFAAFRMLYEQDNPDFAMYVFDEMDRLMHFFWRYCDPNHPAYEENEHSNAFLEHFGLVDSLISDFLDSLDDTTHVLLFSDHGFRALHSDVYVNNWLRDNDYLTTREGEEITTEVTTSIKIKAAIIKVLDKIGIWKYYKNYRLKDETIPVVWYLSHVDWDATRAYLYSMSGQSIRLNIQGRDPHGIVPPEKVKALCDELTEKLKELKDPRNGTPLVEDVIRASDAFHGDYRVNAPDLIVLPAPGYAWQTGFSDSLVKEAEQYGLTRSGDHDPYGVIALSGPAVSTAKIDSYSLEDIAPTVLWLMGCDVSDDMDGTVMLNAITEEYQTEHPVKKYKEDVYVSEDAAPTKEEEDVLTEQLKALGYM